MAGSWNDHDDWSRPPRSSRGLRIKRTIVASVLGAAVLYGLGVWSGVELFNNEPSARLLRNFTTNSGGTNQTALPPGFTSENVINNIYNRSINSIFTITAVTSGSSKDGPQEDVGTGFLIDTHGDIATNDHVVNGLSKVSVTLGQHTFTGTVIGADPLDDLAIVHINAPPTLEPLKLGSANDLQPGDLVVAIGNPFQLTSSVSSGIVSGLNRSMPTQTGHIMNGLIQTDAALNPGNSGGPLFNAAGQVVGINTAIESPVEGSVGIGFAIPIDRLKQLLPKLLSGAQVSHPWLGIEGLDIDSVVQQELGLPVNKGIYVTVVTKGSPADKAGLKGDSNPKIENLPNVQNPKDASNGDGDIIVAADGQQVDSIEKLTQLISAKSPGMNVQLTVLRHGTQQNISVTLGNWPTSTK